MSSEELPRGKLNIIAPNQQYIFIGPLSSWTEVFYISTD